MSKTQRIKSNLSAKEDMRKEIINRNIFRKSTSSTLTLNKEAK